MDPVVLAGAAKVEVTPRVGCWLEGIPRAQPSDAIHDSLFARALVCESDDLRLCLVVCDLIGLSTAFADLTRQRIAESIGTTPEHVIVACAHNHSGPATRGTHNPAHVDHGYMADLQARIVQASAEAASRLQPAQIGVGRSAEHTISQYRRLWTRDGRVVMNWEEYSPEQIVGPVEKGDPELGVVRISAIGGGTIAVLFNYACHPNSLPGDNFTITADFPGYAAHMVEESIGGIAMFTNGAQGSVDIEGLADRDIRGIERRGRALGNSVLEACRAIELDPDPVFGTARSVILMPYRKVSPEQLEWARETLATASGGPVTMRDDLPPEMKAERYLRHAMLTEPGVDFEMVALRLGRAVFITIPGELFTEIGKRVKQLSTSVQIHIVGLANGYVGYIPTAKASAEGGYATDVGTGAYFAEHAEDLIHACARNLLRSLEEQAKVCG